MGKELGVPLQDGGACVVLRILNNLTSPSLVDAVNCLMYFLCAPLGHPLHAGLGKNTSTKTKKAARDPLACVITLVVESLPHVDYKVCAQHGCHHFEYPRICDSTHVINLSQFITIFVFMVCLPPPNARFLDTGDHTKPKVHDRRFTVFYEFLWCIVEWIKYSRATQRVYCCVDQILCPLHSAAWRIFAWKRHRLQLGRRSRQWIQQIGHKSHSYSRLG